MSRRLRIVVAVASALVALLACSLFSSRVRAEAERERSETLKRYGNDVVELVVARRGIGVGETIAASDVDKKEWLSSLAPDGAVLGLEEAVGRKVSVPIAANAPLCDINFRDETKMAEVPSGRVAVSVPITDKLGLAGNVEVGSRVVAYRVRESTSEIVGASAIVLDVPSAAHVSFGQATVTIAVAAQDVGAVLSASASGDLRLVLPAEDVTELSDGQPRVSEVMPEAQDESKQPVEAMPSGEPAAGLSASAGEEGEQDG